MKKRFSRRNILKAASVSAVSALSAGIVSGPKQANAQFSWMKSSAPAKPRGPSHVRFSPDSPSIQYHRANCERCGDCISVCRDIQTVYGHPGNFPASETPCIHCGQCTANCWANAVTERFHLQPAYNEILSNRQSGGSKKFVALIAPSVRVTLGEMFKMEPGTNVEKKLVSGLRKLGFDYVFDVTFGADLTVLEEAAELEAHLNKRAEDPKTPNVPLFTSCCPSWVRFAELFFPEVLPAVSTCKSPIMMHGAVVKTWFAKQMNIAPEDLVVMAFTPCTAKKYERTLGSGKDVDFVLTTRELGWWMQELGIDLPALEEGEFDSMLGNGSGAGVIFGNTGGVTEAVLRHIYFERTGKVPEMDFLLFTPVRGLDGLRRAEVRIGGDVLRVGLVHGTAAARKLLESGKLEELKLDFVEVMACRGGCIGGGGTPKTEIPISDALRTKRMSGLYSTDKTRTIRMSRENPELQKLYADFLKETGNELLHTAKR